MINTTAFYTIILLAISILLIYLLSTERKRITIKRKGIQQLPSLYSPLNQNNNKLLQDINLTIHKQTLLKEEDWIMLKEKINYIYPDFTNRIIQDFPLLTKDDLRIIILLRIGITHEDIARLCNIQLSSFRKRRMRLKQKMNIECKSISTFIQNMYILSS